MLPPREGLQARWRAVQQVRAEMLMLGLAAAPERINRWEMWTSRVYWFKRAPEWGWLWEASLFDFKTIRTIGLCG